jgi:hypothetical protein
MRPLVGALACLGIVIVLGHGLSSCYTPPHPDCGFICGTGGACPADYTCAADNVCHYINAPASTTCNADAKLPTDSPDADVTPPMVTGSTPVDGATSVPRDTIITINFDRRLAPATVTASSVTVFHLATQILGTPTLDPSGVAITFTPAQPLPADAQIAVQLSTAIRSTTGGVFEGKVIGFTTIDDEPPTLAGSLPADMDTGVLVTAPIDVLFSEAVTNVTSTTFHISNGATDLPGTVSSLGGNAFRFMPAADMPAATLITVHLDGGLGGIVDLAGNPLASVQFTFTTL